MDKNGIGNWRTDVKVISFFRTMKRTLIKNTLDLSNSGARTNTKPILAKPTELSEEDLSFLCLKSPRFKDDTFLKFRKRIIANQRIF